MFPSIEKKKETIEVKTDTKKNEP